jgi:hypothetical protein
MHEPKGSSDSDAASGHTTQTHRVQPTASVRPTFTAPASTTRCGANGFGRNTVPNGKTAGPPPNVPLTPPPPTAESTSATTPTGADPDLLVLLPAARAARDELSRQGRSLSRDSLARQLRGQGHTIRTSRVSELLTLLKQDANRPVNGHRPRRTNDRHTG